MPETAPAHDIKTTAWPVCVETWDSRKTAGDSEDDYVIKRWMLDIEQEGNGNMNLVASIEVELVDCLSSSTTLFSWPVGSTEEAMILKDIFIKNRVGYMRYF